MKKIWIVAMTMCILLTGCGSKKDTVIIYSCTEENVTQALNQKFKEDLKDVKVTGQISKNNLDSYNVYLKVSGEMILPCAITLKPVNYPFNIEIDEIFSEDASEMSKKIKKFENTIDILPIVWENILMEIPMRVVSPDASLEKVEGNGWKLVTEDSEFENPELAKLKDLLK